MALMLMSTTLLIDLDRRFRCCCCCNQRRLIKLLSSIAAADADAPAVAADRSTAVVADAADPELC